MSTITLAAIRAWQPEALQSAADQLAIATTTLDDEVNEVRKAMDRATTVWRGPAADAATERARRDVKDGQALVEALRAAKAALATGVLDIGVARTNLLTAVDSAVLAGLRVADDGAVFAELPPVMSSPEKSPAAAAQRTAEQTALQCQTAPTAQAVSDALRAVAEADRRTADALMRIEVPASMRQEVDALLGVAAGDGGLAADLLAWSLGGARLLQAGLRTRTTFSKFLAAFGRLPSAQLFHYGPANGGALRLLMGARAARLVGRAFLPLTVATGAWDAVTGGGYEGRVPGFSRCEMTVLQV